MYEVNGVKTIFIGFNIYNIEKTEVGIVDKRLMYYSLSENVITNEITVRAFYYENGKGCYMSHTICNTSFNPENLNKILTEFSKSGKWKKSN